ncbi:RNA-binding protein [Patescibacteria group bacterium]|nr:RNA-binding protein [Patescibacteria group bacterium]MCL5091230.1 RNA-binding protein [Patescibacteria group bacterium]
MANKIYVGNISPLTTDKDLFDLFSGSGDVISARVNFGLDNKTSRSAYVVMGNETDMKKAIAKNNNTDLKGSRIIVVKAHPVDQDAGFFSNRSRFRKFSRR